jgi:mannose-1-phosphate guanylyltransferase / phosphomannomutase
MRAFILAGGSGTRLSPLTSYVPKCMIPVAGRPFIDHVIEYLHSHNIRDVVLLLSADDAEVFRNHLSDGSKLDVRVQYSVSPRAGTSAALIAASGFVDGPFIVYYGDVMADLDLTGMVSFHQEKGALCTLALSRGVRLDYGVGKLDSEGRMLHFEEKPVLSEYPVSIGIYACQPNFLSYCNVGSDLAADVLPHLASRGEKVYGFVTDQPHHDIGSFKQLNEAKEFLATKKKHVPLPVSRVKKQ